jgi:D-glycero-beta-D-manno-heptose-7-phosphate kinase
MASKVADVVAAFSGLNVLIIGDVMIDSYLWGKVERISPEAPVPILQVQKREMRLGGAGNVALNVQSLGAKPYLCSVIGKDSDGQTLMNLMNERNLDTEGFVRSEERITTIKHRVMSGSHHMLRVDQETDKEINATEKEALKARIKVLIEKCQVVIFEDYDKGVLNPEIIEYTISLAEQKNIPTIVDPKKRNFLSYAGATLFKPNRKEIKEGLKLDLDLKNAEEVEQASTALRTLMQVKGVLLTLSERGVFIDHNRELHHIPAHLREISDVSGAGDTVVSTAALCLAIGLKPYTLAALSNLAGGLVCEQVGVVPIDLDKLMLEAKREGILE